ncbi:MAG: GNAT family N-acetyltransferase [Saprospiraceae bacterium]
MSIPQVNIAVWKELSHEDYLAYCQLIPQLSPRTVIPSKAALAEAIAQPHIHVIIAKTDQLVGALTLVINRLTTGINVRVEDVIVTESMRGKGLSRLLMEEAIAIAQKAGAKSINLTSNPSRIAANFLYQNLGFERYETNVYRLVL